MTWSKDGVRGEITVVVAGADPHRILTPEDLAAEVATRRGGGHAA